MHPLALLSTILVGAATGAIASIRQGSRDFHDGTVVRIEGLASTPQLDGSLGKVVGWDDGDGGRYVVEIAGGTRLLVGGANLEAAAGGARGHGGRGAPLMPGLKKLNASEADPARYLFAAGTTVEIYGTKTNSVNGQLATVVGLNLHLKPPKYVVKLSNGEELKVNPHKLRVTRGSLRVAAPASSDTTSNMADAVEGAAAPTSGTAAGEDGDFALGTAVEAFGLKKLGPLNGEVGMVQGREAKDGRYIVAFSGQQDRAYSLKRQNLRMALVDSSDQ